MGGPIKQIVLCHSESIENLCGRCEHRNFLLFRISNLANFVGGRQTDGETSKMLHRLIFQQNTDFHILTSPKRTNSCHLRLEHNIGMYQDRY